MSPPSRPASADADDVAKWEAEVRAHEENRRQDREFRDTMLQFAARTDTTLTDMRSDMQQHAAEDREQFRQVRRAHRKLAKRVSEMNGQITQTATTSDYNWKLVFAVAAAAVTIFGIIWGVWTAVKGS